MIEDFSLVVASFQSQYGIRLSKELSTMKWSEFKDYLVGISPDTPLGRVVAIRAEDNPEVLKNFTREQKRIRSEWYNKRAKMVTHETMDSYLDYMKKLFIGMAKS